MQEDPQIPSSGATPAPGNVPPMLPASEPPELTVPPPPDQTRKPWPVRQLLAILLSLCLGLFLIDALASFLDDSLVTWFDVHLLSGIRGNVSVLTMLATLLVYALIGLTPMIPKSLFLPVTLFSPLAILALLPFLIYFYGRMHQLAWVISLCQVILGLTILYLAQGGFRFRWPLIAEDRLGARRFSWLNLWGFLLANILVLLPAAGVYLVLCAHLAVDHFSDGFLALRSSGMTVQARKYVRSDGKTIQLVPMSHIGESDFYHKLSQSFPTNSLILMEGVTDNRNLLTNSISYKRAATSLGLAEQHEEFRPTAGKWVSADVDVEEFSRTTIDFLNLVMLVHGKGVNPQTILPLMQYSPPAHFEQQLFDDLLGKRNRRLLQEVQARLPQSDNIIVPWGVAHMPGIAQELQKSGFRVQETREYTAIRFRSSGK